MPAPSPYSPDLSIADLVAQARRVLSGATPIRGSFLGRHRRPGGRPRAEPNPIFTEPIGWWDKDEHPRHLAEGRFVIGCSVCWTRAYQRRRRAEAAAIRDVQLEAIEMGLMDYKDRYPQHEDDKESALVRETRETAADWERERHEREKREKREKEREDADARAAILLRKLTE